MRNFISRADAELKLREAKLSELNSLSKGELVARLMQRGEPRWDRLRNYEFEFLLAAAFAGDKWVIGEFCPFNGKYCAYGDHQEGRR